MADSSRMSMIWPNDLKDQVREVVGERGLTKFTLAAVREKLSGNPEPETDTKALRRELDDARFVAQQLADTIVRFGDYEDPMQVLQTIGLPEWIDTRGWPESAADLVKKSEPEIGAPDPDPIVPAEEKAEVVPEETVVPSEPEREPVTGRFGTRSDFLERVLAQSDGSLKRASEIEAPEKVKCDVCGSFIDGDGECGNPDCLGF